MKFKNLLLSGALPLALFAACSSDDAPNTGGGQIVNQDGHYISVCINLPTTPSSRAANDKFDDGTPNEYKVFSGCLVIFKGANKATATFAAAYDLQALNPDEDVDNDNITSRFLKTVKLDNLSYAENDNLYGFVMLNYKEIAQVTDKNGLSVNGAPLNSNSTYEMAFLQETSNRMLSGNEELSGNEGSEYSFFMCNAPLSNKIGGSSNPGVDGFTTETLVELLKSSIKPTKDEAEKATAASFYVERGVAKAQLEWKAEFIEDKDGAEAVKANGESAKFEVIGWTLDATQNTSYIGRNVVDADWWSYSNSELSPANYRFVGSSPMGSIGTEDLVNIYRTYWCYDPSYSTDKPDLLYKNFGYDKESKSASFSPGSKVLYCHENTFDVAHQDYNNTTRAVIQATLKFGEGVNGKPGTFYVLDGKKDNIFTSKEAVESYPRNAILGSQIIKEILDDALISGKSYNTDMVTNIVNIQFDRIPDTGIRKVTDITLDLNKADLNVFDVEKLTLTSEQKAQLISDANSYEIEEYVDGNCYYEVRFMHFATNPDYTGGSVTPGNLAPWKSDLENVTSTGEAYDVNATNYLGRYGMVRNNWYLLQVNKVYSLGSPVVPKVEGDKTPDDNKEKEQYIAFEINVLSWAKRLQSVDF